MGSDASRITWFRRNRKWFIPVALGVPLAALSLGFAITAAVVMHNLKQTQPFRLALERVRTSEEVAQWTGRPMEPGWLVQGAIEQPTEAASQATPQSDADVTESPEADAVANLLFSVEGPDGGAGVRVYATQRAGEWTLQYVDVGVKRGERESIIVLVDTGERPAGSEGPTSDGT